MRNKLKEGLFAEKETHNKINLLTVLHPEVVNFMYWDDNLSTEEIVDKIINYTPSVIILPLNKQDKS